MSINIKLTNVFSLFSVDLLVRFHWNIVDNVLTRWKMQLQCHFSYPIMAFWIMEGFCDQTAKHKHNLQQEVLSIAGCELF